MSLKFAQQPTTPPAHIHAHFTITPVTEVHQEKTENQYHKKSTLCTLPTKPDSATIKQGETMAQRLELEKTIKEKREEIQKSRAKVLRLRIEVMRETEQLECDEHALGFLEGRLNAQHGIEVDPVHHSKPMKTAAMKMVKAHPKYVKFFANGNTIVPGQGDNSAVQGENRAIQGDGRAVEGDGRAQEEEQDDLERMLMTVFLANGEGGEPMNVVRTQTEQGVQMSNGKEQLENDVRIETVYISPFDEPPRVISFGAF